MLGLPSVIFTSSCLALASDARRIEAQLAAEGHSRVSGIESPMSTLASVLVADGSQRSLFFWRRTPPPPPTHTFTERLIHYVFGTIHTGKTGVIVPTHGHKHRVFLRHELNAMSRVKVDLDAALKLLYKAVRKDWHGGVVSADSKKLIQAFEACAKIFEDLGFGRHLQQNIGKLKSSRAMSSSRDYKEALLSEIPLHARSDYRDYADPSAGVASIWIGWILEFFVEMLANVDRGRDPTRCIFDAYWKTLSHHQGMLQRRAFRIGLRRTRNRRKMLVLLRENAHFEVEQFVKAARPVVRYLQELHEIQFKLFKAERKLLKRRRGRFNRKHPAREAQRK